MNEVEEKNGVKEDKGAEEDCGAEEADGAEEVDNNSRQAILERRQKILQQMNLPSHLLSSQMSVGLRLCWQRHKPPPK